MQHTYQQIISFSTDTNRYIFRTFLNNFINNFLINNKRKPFELLRVMTLTTYINVIEDAPKKVLSHLYSRVAQNGYTCKELVQQTSDT